jgi:hypothetical protein
MSIAGHKARFAALATHSGGRYTAAPPGHTSATTNKGTPKHGDTPVIARQTQLAALVTTHAVFSRPAASARSLGRIQAKGYYTRERTVLPVLGHRVGANGQRWLHVSLPGRPNGRSGWIAQRATIARSTPWHIVVDIRARRVTVYHSDRSVRVVRAVVGEPSTPTPVGHFFVQETIKLGPDDVGAPDALALSAAQPCWFISTEASAAPPALTDACGSPRR